ncbi:hypothetical protein JYU34_009425 [Plutella xylostella]|uniref:Uncharacterized protein n=1 Tax=Plutella xylostella TaxID=51655 RepID=A0ABQ7QMT2_PLUXY|nr:hypothetical protein JYU34_009425 [Plutella xylostella]
MTLLFTRYVVFVIVLQLLSRAAAAPAPPRKTNFLFDLLKNPIAEFITAVKENVDLSDNPTKTTTDKHDVIISSKMIDAPSKGHRRCGKGSRADSTGRCREVMD